MNKLKIRVPATTANLGSGFDALGMALKIYNEVEVERADKTVITAANPYYTRPENNIVFKAAQNFCKQTGTRLPALNIHQKDNIPIGKGLGSSAACIVAGLMAANALTGANLSKDELIDMAAAEEGYPDNSTPALTGGIVSCINDNDHIHHIKFDAENMKSAKFIAAIPDFSLSTKKARAILPEKYTRADAVFNISRSAFLMSAAATSDMDKFILALDDRLHQEYRLNFIPNMDKIFDFCHQHRAGAYLSGAGPTLMAVTKSGNDQFYDLLNNYTKTLDNNWTLRQVEIDGEGARIL